jgi:hypothetical protein
MRFDKVFAIHVGVFAHRRPARELRVIGGCLAEGGSLHLAYQPLRADEVEETAGTLSTVLEEHGFTVDSVVVEDLGEATVVCVAAGKT